MTEDMDATSKKKIWVRGFFMLLMMLIYQIAGTVMFVVTIIQFVLALLSNSPNERLVAFGKSLAQYLRQIACYLTFASEETPFPFSNWPSEDNS